MTVIEVALCSKFFSPRHHDAALDAVQRPSCDAECMSCSCHEHRLARVTSPVSYHAKRVVFTASGASPPSLPPEPLRFRSLVILQTDSVIRCFAAVLRTANTPVAERSPSRGRGTLAVARWRRSLRLRASSGGVVTVVLERHRSAHELRRCTNCTDWKQLYKTFRENMRRNGNAHSPHAYSPHSPRSCYKCAISRKRSNGLNLPVLSQREIRVCDKRCCTFRGKDVPDIRTGTLGARPPHSLARLSLIASCTQGGSSLVADGNFSVRFVANQAIR